MLLLFLGSFRFYQEENKLRHLTGISAFLLSDVLESVLVRINISFSSNTMKNKQKKKQRDCYGVRAWGLGLQGHRKQKFSSAFFLRMDHCRKS